MSKRIWMGCLAVLFASSCATTGGAQVETAPPPPPVEQGPAPAAAALNRAPVTDGDVTEAWVNGMQILVKRNPEAELVSGQLAVLGGVFNWDGTNAGVEQLALTVAQSGGTQRLDKDAFARRLASMGSDVWAGAGGDYSMFGFKSLLRFWDETFGMMAETFLTPAMPADEIELKRTRQLQALKRELEFPDSRLGLATHQRLFAGHPYQHRSIGTPETVAALTREQLLAQLAKLRETRRLVLVVVGNVDPQLVVERAKAVFGGLPAGDFHQQEIPQLKFEHPSVQVLAEQLPTTYITGVFGAPSWKEPQFAAAMVAIDVLRNRLWDEVRTKRNLSYAPSAGVTMNSFVPRGSIYVTAVDPNTTVKVMLDEARKLAAQQVPAPELEGSKAQYRTRFLMGTETTDGQAGLLMRSQLYGGDWRVSRSLPDQLKAVTPADIQSFAQQYLSRLQMVVLGDPAKIDDALFRSL
ncbi:MAG: insulinase family protein [Myxococcota bacterium]|nr:insulinase family protein [Myxococcota bacterium]